MTRLHNVTNIFLGICYEIFFALAIVGGAFFICLVASLITLKP
jgi:hypothetical protein